MSSPREDRDRARAALRLVLDAGEDLPADVRAEAELALATPERRGRPRVGEGETRALRVAVPAETMESLDAEAARRGVLRSQVARERLAVEAEGASDDNEG